MSTYVIKDFDDILPVMRSIQKEFERIGSIDIVVSPHTEGNESRSNKQSRLQFLWYGEAAAQKKDYDVEGYRGLCKLHIGVAIRKEKESFRLVYDEHIKPLSYEQKIACMKEPLNFPITSEMTVKEMCRYLEGVEVFLSEMGVVLSRPEDIYWDSLGIKRK